MPGTALAAPVRPQEAGAHVRSTPLKRNLHSLTTHGKWVAALTDLDVLNRKRQGWTN